MHFEDGVVYAEPGIDVARARGGRPDGQPRSATATCSSAAPRRRRATPGGASRAAATRGAAAPRSWCDRPCERARAARWSPLVAAGDAARRLRARRPGRPTCSCSPAPARARKLTLLVNDGGTIRCNGGKAEDALRPAADHGPRSGRQPRRRRDGQADDPARARTASTHYTDQACSRARSASPTATPPPARPRPGRAVRRPGRAAGLRAQSG